MPIAWMRDAQLGAPDLAGVVLHPSGTGEDLRELLLCDGYDAARAVEHDGAGGGGALVEGKDVVAHVDLVSSLSRV
jgi:hypothetical protein